MDTNIISELIKMVSKSSLTSLEVEEGSLKVKITNQPNVVPQTTKIEVVDDVDDIEVKAGHVIKSPIVGIYHGLSKAGKEDIKVGDSVKKGDVLCVVEAMKLMNEVECDIDGIIEQILIEDGHQIEYGQPLFIIKS